MPDAFNVEMGQRLARTRKARGLQQKQAAALLGINNDVLCCYEHGKRTLPFSVLIKMGQLYGVSFDVILNLSHPIPHALRADRTQSHDTLSWRVEGMLAEYRETGRFYLLHWGEGRVCWVRHDPAASAIVLLSSFQPGGPEGVPQRYQADELAELSAERIAAILNGITYV